MRGLQPPYWLQPPLEARAELGKTKRGEEKNRVRRGGEEEEEGINPP